MRSKLYRRAVLAAVVALLATSGTTSAHAATGWESGFWPNDSTTPDVVHDCRTKDHHLDGCWFRPLRLEYGRGKWHDMGRTFTNCAGRRPITFTAQWATTVTDSISVANGTSYSATINATPQGIGGWFTATQEMTVTTGHGTASSFSQSVSASLRPREYATVQFRPHVIRYFGFLEAHYTSRQAGHYFWYYPSNTASARGSSVQLNRPQTDAWGNAKGDVRVVIHKC